VLVGAVSAGVALGSAAHAANRAANPPATGPVIVVGAGGLSWSDVSRTNTPALWSLLRDGAGATVTVRSVHTNTCPLDGWLTISAGQRAGDVSRGSGTKPPCRAVQPPTGGTVPRWGDYVGQAARDGFDARPGLLADELARAGQCVQAVGPGAAILAARSNGTVARYAPFAGDLAAQLAACPVTAVDVGAVRDPADVDPADDVRPTESRAAQVKAVDDRIATVLQDAPAGADVLVVGLADAGRSERLRLIAMTGPNYGAGSLESSSTRQPGLVQLTDITPTVLQHLRVPVPSALGGSPLRLMPANGNSEENARQRLQSLVDYDQASHEVHSLVPPFFNGWVYAQLAIYLFVAFVWKRRFGSRETRLRLLRVVRRVATIAAAVPVSTFLANLLPWWRSSTPGPAIVGAVAVFVAIISAISMLGPWRRALMGPMAAVSTITLIVLAADVMTGSRLQLSSLMGLQPVVGGRFYGMGNVTFALFATAALMLSIAVADRLVRQRRIRTAAAAVAAIGLAAVIVDGSPSWGSDFGGPPALLPGVAFFVLTILGIRLTWRRVLLIGGGTVGFLALLGIIDWLRPEDSRSHLGRFVQSVVDGTEGDIISRKLAQNMSILFGSTLTLLVPVGLFFVIYILARPTSWGSRALQRSFERAPMLRPGLIALVITLALGFALNDSGTAIPAVAATVAIPLVIAVSVRTLEDEEQNAPRQVQQQYATRAERHRR
jgi:hypothetical protein